MKVAACNIKFSKREEQMDDPKFEVHCDASPNGQLRVKSHALSVAVGQSISMNNTQEVWQSVLIICEEGKMGRLRPKSSCVTQIGTKTCKSPAFAHESPVRTKPLVSWKSI